MNEIFSNLLVLIPLSFLIAIRILQSRAQRKERFQTKQLPHSKRGSQGERTSLSAAIGVRGKRPMYPMAQEVAAKFKEGEFVSGGEEQPTYVAERKVLPEEPVSVGKDRSVLKEEKHPASLPEAVAKLSPWKQAVVFREILGPPKGW